jgi:hypothetical protein
MSFEERRTLGPSKVGVARGCVKLRDEVVRNLNCAD